MPRHYITNKSASLKSSHYTQSCSCWRKAFQGSSQQSHVPTAQPPALFPLTQQHSHPSQDVLPKAEGCSHAGQGWPCRCHKAACLPRVSNHLSFTWHSGLSSEHLSIHTNAPHHKILQELGDLQGFLLVTSMVYIDLRQCL